MRRHQLCKFSGAVRSVDVDDGEPAACGDPDIRVGMLGPPASDLLLGIGCFLEASARARMLGRTFTTAFAAAARAVDGGVQRENSQSHPTISQGSFKHHIHGRNLLPRCAVDAK